MKSLHIAHIMGASGKNTSHYKGIKPMDEHFIARGHSVDYIWWEDFDDIAGPHEHYVLIDGLTSGDKKSAKKSKRGRKLWGRHLYYIVNSKNFCAQLDRALDLKRYDAVFIHAINIIPMWRLNCPHFFVPRNIKSMSFIEKRGYNWFTKPLYKKLYSAILKKMYIATISTDVKQDLIDYFGVPAQQITPVFSSVDTHHLAEQASQLPDIDLPEHYLISAGRGDTQKRFDRLLRAYAASQTRVPLLLFGDGKLFTELKQQARELGIQDRVFFPGYYANLMPYYQHAIATLITSDYEGLPRVVLESLSVGVPVLATDFPGTGDIFTGDMANWVVPRDDEALLAQKIAEFAEDPPQVPSNAIADFTPEKITENYLQLIESHQGKI